MASVIIEGFLLGLFLSVFIGPVFFLLIDTSIKRGVKSAFVMDAGVILSDVFWIVLLYWGVDKYLGNFLESDLSMIIAGSVFIAFGLAGFLSLKKKKENKVPKKNSKLFIEGFILNTINPSVALFWLASLTIAVKKYTDGLTELFVFFGAIFITIIAIDFLKFNGAKRLSVFLNDKRQRNFSLFSNGVLFLFGIYMLISHF